MFEQLLRYIFKKVANWSRNTHIVKYLIIIDSLNFMYLNNDFTTVMINDGGHSLKQCDGGWTFLFHHYGQDENFYRKCSGIGNE